LPFFTPRHAELRALLECRARNGKARQALDGIVQSRETTPKTSAPSANQGG